MKLIIVAQIKAYDFIYKPDFNICLRRNGFLISYLFDYKMDNTSSILLQKLHQICKSVMCNSAIKGIFLFQK